MESITHLSGYRRSAAVIPLCPKEAPYIRLIRPDPPSSQYLPQGWWKPRYDPLPDRDELHHKIFAVTLFLFFNLENSRIWSGFAHGYYF